MENPFARWFLLKTVALFQCVLSLPFQEGLCFCFMSVVIYNNQFYNTREPVLPHHNRAFRYGDGIFETMRVINGQVHLFSGHMARLRYGAGFLKFKLPGEWTNDFFYDRVLSLLEANKLGKQARVRLSVFRAGDGYYTPRKNTACFLLESERFGQVNFPLNEHGLKIDLYSGMEKGKSPFANLKSINAQLYVMAGLHKKEHGLDDCLILNHHNRVAEAISANLFCVRKGILYTPPLSESCVDGVMRKHLIELAEREHIPVVYRPIKLEDLFEAYELFLANAIMGLRWVGQFKSKTYDCQMTQHLAGVLNLETQRTMGTD